MIYEQFTRIGTRIQAAEKNPPTMKSETEFDKTRVFLHRLWSCFFPFFVSLGSVLLPSQIVFFFPFLLFVISTPFSGRALTR